MKGVLERLSPLFYPRSIAVVGASKDERKIGYILFHALLKANFKGEVYPINPSGGEVLGAKIYPRLVDVPGPVDYVLISIPAASVPPVLDDCAAKGVKIVQLFTAGYRELGEEGHRREQELIKAAQRGGFRILGPNCIGSYSPAVNKPWGPFGATAEKGKIGLISQGGSIAIWLQLMASARGFPLGKGVHFGNGADIDSPELIEYFAADSETEIIACYLEGTKRGRELLEVIKKVSPYKPIVMWKAGATEAGAKAAASHTGSLIASDVVWSCALRQAGAIQVEGLEEMADVLLALNHLSPFKGGRAAIICGFADGGGGESVASADGCIRGGLDVPSFSPPTKAQVKELLGEVGSILINPLDISQKQAQPEVLKMAMEVAAADPVIDILLVGLNVDVILGIFSPQALWQLMDILVSLRRRKPVAVVMPSALAKEKMEAERKLGQASIPVFPTMERAATAISKISQYFRAKGT